MATIENVGPMKQQIIRGIRFPAQFCQEAIEETMDMIPNPGDLVLATYPKCGTNWVAQILSLILKKGVPPQTGQDLLGFCPYLEFTGPEVLDKQQPPRCYKVHFDYTRVPKHPEAKYLCVIRNPKDCLISFFHFAKADLLGFKGGNFDDFFGFFVEGKMIYNDYFDHLLTWYEHRHDDNVLFLYYEKLKKDSRANIKDIAAFMGGEYQELIADDKVLEDVVKYSSFEYMKSTTNKLMASVFRSREKVEDIDSLNVPKGVKHTLKYAKEAKSTDSIELVRKGIVGDWKTVLTSEQSQIIDDLIEKRIKGTEMYDYWKSIGCI